MSKKNRHVRTGNYGRDQGAFARSARERAEQKAEAAKKPAPATAPKVNPYDRLRAKIDADRPTSNQGESGANGELEQIANEE